MSHAAAGSTRSPASSRRLIVVLLTGAVVFGGGRPVRRQPQARLHVQHLRHARPGDAQREVEDRHRRPRARAAATLRRAVDLRPVARSASCAAPGGQAASGIGILAFAATVPVAVHCIWAYGFQTSPTRVFVHSLAGCLFYGAFAAKVVVVRSRRLPGWVLPVAGGLLFTVIVVIWYSVGVVVPQRIQAAVRRVKDWSHDGDRFSTAK